MFENDELKRLSSITAPIPDGAGSLSAPVTAFPYNNLELLTFTTDALNVTTDYEFDALSRTTRIEQFLDQGRITGFTSADGTTTYTYDDVGQLTDAEHSYQTDESYEYDANGNRVHGGYQIGDNNRLLSDGTYNYQYDDEGNRTRRVHVASGASTEYEWDHRNRLIRVTEKDGQENVSSVVEYTYDVFDRRIAKEVDADGDSSFDYGERYVYDGRHIALKFDEAGNLTNRFLHGPVIDQIFADEDALGNVLWMLADNQGTVRDVAAYDAGLDETTVVNHITYDSFGRITGQSNAAYEPHFGYTGREWDAETGMWYYRARWYDAETGQFLSEDPLGFAAGDANLKRYVFNSPPNWTDPSGLSGGGTGGEGGDGGGSEPSGGGGVYNPYGPSGGYWPSFYSPWYPIPHPVPDFSMEVQDAINNILNMQVGDTNVDGNVNWQSSGPPGWTLGTNTPFGPGSWLTTGIAGTGNNIVQTNIGLQYHVPNFSLTTQLQNSHQNVVGIVLVQGSGFGGGTAFVAGGASGSGWNPADWDYVWQIGQSNQIVDLQGPLIPGVDRVEVVSSVTYGNISPAQPGQPIDPGRPTANWNMNMNIQLNPLWGFNPFSQITIGVTTPIHSGSSPNFNIIFER